MIVGSTDRISTSGPPAFAANGGSTTAIAANKGTLNRRICWVSRLSLLGQPPFLTGAQAEGERYFQECRSAIPSLRCPFFGSPAVERKATVPNPANAAIVVGYRANSALRRRRFWGSPL